MKNREKRGRTTLSGNNTTFFQGTVQQLEIWLLEQTLRWPLWVTTIRDDYIKLVLLIRQEFETVADVGRNIRVLETDAHAWEVFLG